jgi:hypothetical protein
MSTTERTVAFDGGQGLSSGETEHRATELIHGYSTTVAHPTATVAKASTADRSDAQAATAAP